MNSKNYFINGANKFTTKQCLLVQSMENIARNEVPKYFISISLKIN